MHGEPRDVGGALAALTVRAGTPADAGAVAALIATFHTELTDEPSGRGAEAFLASVSVDAERAYLGSGRYAYLVAHVEDRLVGFVAVRDRNHLFHLFVARSHQRKGLARLLWNRARTDAVARGGSGQFTVNASLPAVPAYRAFGFVVAGAPRHAHGITFQPMTLQGE